METPNLIIDLFLFALIVAGLSSSSSAHNKIKVLEASLNWRHKQDFKEIEALEHTIALKDEKIKHLNGDIAKFKFDYAAEVAGRNESKEVTQGKAFEPSRLRGEWVDELNAVPLDALKKVCETCGGRGKYRKPFTAYLSDCDVCGETGELEKSKARYLRAINVLKSVRHNLRVGGQNEKTTEELKERVKFCIDEYNKTKPKDQ